MMQKLNISCHAGALLGSLGRPGNKYREAYTGNYAGRSGECPLQESFSPVRSVDAGDDVVTCAEVSIDSTVLVMVGWSLSGFEGCGMYKEKRTRTWETLDRPFMGSAAQLTEERMLRTGESDPFIVVGDGRAAHMAKGRALSQQSSANNAGNASPRNHCQVRYSNFLNGSSVSRASVNEEPYAGKPHVGICEGAAR